jgi:hypothetical protein
LIIFQYFGADVDEMGSAKETAEANEEGEKEAAVKRPQWTTSRGKASSKTNYLFK